MSQYLTMVSCNSDSESSTGESWVIEVFDDKGDNLIGDGYASTYEEALLEAFRGLDREDR